MSDARVIHKKGSHGKRIIALDHLEFRVWVQYILSADDYGVMRASASVLRADNPRLERERPEKRIDQAMATILQAGLVQSFEHQGELFWWQRDWNDYQKIRHPRETVNPWPSAEQIRTATVKQQQLFATGAALLRERSGIISEIVPPLAGAGARETLPLTQTQTVLPPDREESPRETSLAVARPIRPTRSRGLAGNHMGCYFAPEACARGLCVPSWLGLEWAQQFADPVEAEADIRGFVIDTLARLPDGPVGDEPKAFWRAAWKARHGSASASRAGSRTGDTVDAARDFLRERVASLTTTGEH